MSNRKLYAVLIAATILASLSANWSAEAQQVTPQVRATKFFINRWGWNSTKGGSDIVVNVRDTVRITIVNNDTINHNWGVDVLSPAAFNVRTPTIRGVGNTTSVEFVAGIPGVFKYYCNVGQHRRLGLEGNLVVNAIAAPPPDVSSRVKTLEDQVSSLSSLTNQVRDLDGQVKSISSSITNQVKGLDDQIKSLSSSVTSQVKGVDDQVKSVSSSVKSLASASDQVALKALLDSVSGQNTLLMGLLGVATLLAIVALGVAVMAARKKSS